MPEPEQQDSQPTAEEAARQAEKFSRQAEEAAPGLFKEFLLFLIYNKKWWLAPILFVLLLIGALVLLTGSAAGPFIYPLF